MAVTIGSIEIADNGSFAVEGKWISGEKDSVIIGGIGNEKDFPASPSKDGTGSKDFGRRSQTFTVRAVYVSSNPASDANSDFQSMQPGPFAASVNGVAVTRCFADAEGCSCGQPKSASGSGGLQYAIVTFKFTSRD